MANFKSISATGKSIERLLTACFVALQPVEGKVAKAVLVRSDDFQRDGNSKIPSLGISIFLYRVEVNKVMRPGWSAVAGYDGEAHLPIDLHYLLTAWAENAEHEQQILGRAMQCLETTPSLSGPLLYPSAGWAPNEAVFVTIEDLGLDSLMRAFDVLEADYRVSVAYRARVVRIDGVEAVPAPSTTTVVTGIVP
jgi:hypothetical protein